MKYRSIVPQPILDLLWSYFSIAVETRIFPQEVLDLNMQMQGLERWLSD